MVTFEDIRENRVVQLIVIIAVGLLIGYAINYFDLQEISVASSVTHDILPDFAAENPNAFCYIGYPMVLGVITSIIPVISYYVVLGFWIPYTAGYWINGYTPVYIQLMSKSVISGFWIVNFLWWILAIVPYYEIFGFILIAISAGTLVVILIKFRNLLSNLYVLLGIIGLIVFGVVIFEGMGLLQLYSIVIIYAMICLCFIGLVKRDWRYILLAIPIAAITGYTWYWFELVHKVIFFVRNVPWQYWAISW